VADALPPDADLSTLAASLQSAARDSAVFFNVLCATLESALPGGTTVERDHRLFKRARAARKVTIRLGDDSFEAEMSAGRLAGRQVHAVHGVGGGLPFSKEMPMDLWMTAVVEGLERDAQASAAATAALRSLTT
jgi:hypothetical protein